jgi:hypothetical protein
LEQQLTTTTSDADRPSALRRNLVAKAIVLVGVLLASGVTT